MGLLKYFSKFEFNNLSRKCIFCLIYLKSIPCRSSNSIKTSFNFIENFTICIENAGKLAKFLIETFFRVVESIDVVRSNSKRCLFFSHFRFPPRLIRQMWALSAATSVQRGCQMATAPGSQLSKAETSLERV